MAVFLLSLSTCTLQSNTSSKQVSTGSQEGLCVCVQGALSVFEGKGRDKGMLGSVI